jgi:phage/plasmid-associated DNA primase
VSDLDYYEIAHALISEYHIITFNGKIFVYSDGFYTENKGLVEKDIIKILNNSGRSRSKSYTDPTGQILHIIRCETLEQEFPFNNSKDLVPVQNGVLKINFTSGNVTLIEDSPNHRFTYRLPVVFNPDADPSEIVKYLESLGCDIDLLTQIPAQALLSMLGKNYKKSYLCIGEKNSGKTTFLDMLNEQFFGEPNCSNIPLDTLMNVRFEAAGLVGKLINIADELSNVRLEDLGKFKAITGGGHINIERKFCDSFSYQNKTILLFATNDFPPIQCDDPAFWERWIVLQFPNSFPVDPTFAERWFTEKNISALLNLVLGRIRDIIAKGSVITIPWEQTRETWLNGSDPFYRYINTHLERDIESFVSCDELYKNYVRSRKNNNQIAITSNEFGRRIQRAGASKRQKTITGKKKWCYFGFKIRHSQLNV